MSTRDPFGVSSNLGGFSPQPLDKVPSYREELQALDGAIVSSDEDETPARPILPFLGIGALVFLLLVGQCFRLQVLGASRNQALAQGNSVRIITQQPERGLILDANGTVIAQNSRRLALFINPQTLPRKLAERELVYEYLKEKIGLTEEERNFIENNRLDRLGGIRAEPFPLRTSLSQEESLLAFEWFTDTPGVQVEELPVRRYADIPSLGHLLGYVGPVTEADINNGMDFNQLVGKNGLELTYNQTLTGTPGKLHAEVNSRGQVVRYVADDLSTPPVVGESLRLSIDTKLQQAVADALKRELDRRTQKYGPLPRLGASAVVLNPNDGSILAMVSLPDYPSNAFAQGISQQDYTALTTNPGTPLLNRAIQGTYAPGSTIKPLVAAAALQEGLITANTTVTTPAALQIGQFRFPDWKYHGLTNTRKAIAESNNIFFYALGGGWEEGGIRGLGIDRMNAYLSQFGLGTKTGVDLPSERDGLLPDDAWKRATQNEPWYIGNTYQSAIGQGFVLATPLQMALGTSAIANGGTVWQPHLAKSRINPTTQEETLFPPVPLRENFISANHLQTVREGMRQAVETGSARLLNQLRVTSAGKTGTAQFGNQGLTHAWYTGYAPHDKPEIAFAIVIEGGGDSYYSSVPVAEEILRAYFNEPVPEGGRLFSEPSAGRTAEIAAEFAGER